MNNKNISFSDRAKELVKQMTLEEKISQMLHKSPSIKRLNVKSYNWWGEALHGVARAGVATVFPQSIALASTFDKNLLFEIGDVVSTEARAKFHEFQRNNDHDIYKGLTLWAPNINIFRDPRWGRGQETFGEDPYLTSILGVSYIKGLQGNDPKYLKVAACAKHFAVHSGPESKRHEFNAVVSEKDLYETYLPAFYECVTNANVEAVMGAYNRTNNEPCCGSKTLLTDILRKKWGFKGHVVSDCWAIKDFHENHLITKTAPESVALAVKTGCDLNCGNLFMNLMQAVDESLISVEEIDTAVIRLFTTRMKLGMFDNQDLISYSNISYEKNDCIEHRNFNKEVSKRTMVLLKNKNNILPIDKNKINSIAVIGPNANSRIALKGNYFGSPSKYVTVLDGIRNILGNTKRIYYAEGCHLYKDRTSNLSMEKNTFSEAVSASSYSDLTILCLGLDSTIEGEEGDVSNEYASGDKLSLSLPKIQQDLMETLHKTGKPIILLLLTGSALSINWADKNIPAIMQCWYPGAEGGNAISEILFGLSSPSGKLPITFYKSTEELPDFEDYSMENRTYRYMKEEALYPFGYGLSYTKFKYFNIKKTTENLPPNTILSISFLIKNTGIYSSYETIQFYIKLLDPVNKQPKWSLKDTKIISLTANECLNINFDVTFDMLTYIDDNGNKKNHKGDFELYFGGSQPDLRSQQLLKTKINKILFKK
ncbi:MAG: glycoside hydrolase family 3 C-terminal domain-containing protein [Clostridiales bacterium]